MKNMLTCRRLCVCEFELCGRAIRMCVVAVVAKCPCCGVAQVVLQLFLRRYAWINIMASNAATAAKSRVQQVWRIVFPRSLVRCPYAQLCQSEKRWQVAEGSK